MSGKVYLVGAGPGDPELLTRKALRLLRAADVVLHDDLVAPEILALIPPTARLHNVGKRCGRKSITQEEINALLVAYASDGLTVVRLKGGDPLIFGRAGEEMEVLWEARIDFEVVPGVTAALGAAAAARIPLTDRRLRLARHDACCPYAWRQLWWFGCRALRRRPERPDPVRDCFGRSHPARTGPPNDTGEAAPGAAAPRACTAHHRSGGRGGSIHRERHRRVGRPAQHNRPERTRIGTLRSPGDPGGDNALVNGTRA